MTLGLAVQALAVGAEAHAEDLARVPSKGEDHLARLRVQHLHRPVPGRRGKVLAVGAEANAVDKTSVSPEGESLLASLRVPYPHGLVIAHGGGLGVDGIATDRPAWLRQQLAS